MRNYQALPVPDSIWKKPSHFIAFGFGSGIAPFAPGTFGTLMAIPFYLVMAHFSNGIYLALLVLITLGSSWLLDRVSGEIKVHDHPGMCLDEFVGFFVTMFNAPQGWIWIVMGFLLFRLFDIWKPWPIGYIDEHMKGGFGMVFDDVLAGVYSWIILYFIHRLW